ncbi:MAG: KTSC domain-containing protein [Bacteroidota bacterium]
MERVIIDSANLCSVGYEATTSLLEIEFHDGKILQYSDVPKSTVKGLMLAPSQNEFFHYYIKDQFQFSKVS